MTLANIAGSSFLLLLGIFIVQQALQLDYSSDYGPGPGFLPFWIGIVIVTLSSILMVMNILGRQKDRNKTTGLSLQAGRALIAWGLLMVSIALLDRLGFITSFAFLALILSLVFDRPRPAIAVAVAVGGALGFYLIFVLILGVPLPRGAWGF